ncbi:hypothetical protein [Halosimplex halophilum]|uniref:hypothetical protein n=1 Tax=Halosimplex halophilum TaxID=2559572 RepID=UPI00107F4ED4|nr:hypothetical protein [Halosimplex halophilum]
MATESGRSLTDDGKLLFGAGFVFGVMVTLVMLGVVAAVVAANAGGLTTTAVAALVGGVVFAGIVGSGLFLLAFPENRTRIPVDDVDFGIGDEE